MPKDSATQAGCYADLLAFHLLKHGTRPGGSPDRPGKLWQFGEFARTAGISDRSLRNYRKGDLPNSDQQNRIERALFGNDNDDAYKTWKERLRLAVQRPTRTTGASAESIDDDGLTTNWTILQRTGTDGIAELRLHPPVPGNVPGTFYVNATLRLSRGEYDYRGENDDNNRTVLIGLREAFLSFDSPSYQPAEGKMIGERAENAHCKPVAGGVKICGPLEDGCLAGDPLGGEHMAVIEPAGDGDQTVTLSLHAGRLGFRVVSADRPHDETETAYASANRDAILNALICSGLGRDRQGRFILARARMKRKQRP